MKKINVIELDKIIENNNSLFLCGNGLSMNFDSDFGNVFNRLYEAHRVLIRDSKYEVAKDISVYFKKKCLENYKNVLQYVKYFSENELKNIFKDGCKFAKSIIENKIILEELKQKGLIIELVFGRSQIDLLYEISNIEDEKDIGKINIEYWTILIYFYFAIKNLNSDNYEFPLTNSFLTVVELGDTNKTTFMKDNKIQDFIIESILFNGFNTYYRLLFCTAIFSNGKGFELKQLNRLSNLSIEKITNYLNNYNSIMTLNYDCILDNLLSNVVVSHLHGKFISEKEYVHGQSLGLKYDNGNKYVSFSDILIGDYFYNKTYRSTINHMAKNSSYNRKPNHISDTINNCIKEKNIDTVTIFGMNIQNDQHVVRNIMMGFFFAKIKNPKIIYCYYCENEAKEFDNIIFSEEASEYAKNIEVKYIDTHEILENYFIKCK